MLRREQGESGERAGGRFRRVMAPHHYASFETPLGHCAIAWSKLGVALLVLPATTEEQTRLKVQAQLPQAVLGTPSGHAKRAISGVVRLLEGQRVDLATIPLDFDGVPPFHRRVYELAQSIPPGATLTYGEVATRLGSPGAARAVGQALAKNPFAIIVPCHRVLAAGGKLGGFTADGGVNTKRTMLEIEGALGPTSLFDASGGFAFDPELAVSTLRRADAQLARLMDAVGPFRMGLKNTSSVFSALTEAIVYQQLNGKAAKTIYDRLCAAFPRATHGPSARQILAATDDTLRGVGLSRNKLLSLRDLAEKMQSGTLPTLAEAQRLDDEALIERLVTVRGVGRWTAEMFLMFGLGRPDVLALDDFGLKRGFAVTFNAGETPTRERFERHAERWRPYRTVACWYLWRAAERAPKPTPAEMNASTPTPPRSRVAQSAVARSAKGALGKSTVAKRAAGESNASRSAAPASLGRRTASSPVPRGARRPL